MLNTGEAPILVLNGWSDQKLFYSFLYDVFMLFSVIGNY